MEELVRPIQHLTKNTAGGETACGGFYPSINKMNNCENNHLWL